MDSNPYQAPQADVGGTALSSGKYEFSELENSTIRSTASRTKIWGGVSLTMGVLSALGLGLLLMVWGAIEAFIVSSGQPGMNTGVMVGAIALLIPLSLVNLVIGVFYIGSGRALAAVADTEGNDVELLMSSLDRLANAFRLEVILTAVGIVIGLVMSIANAATAAAG